MWKYVLVAVVVLATTAVPVAGGGAAKTSGALDLRASLRLTSIRGQACPPGSSSTSQCATRTATGVVAGLGNVTESYTYVVDHAHPSCSDESAKVLGYPVRWTVAGKGDIQFAVAPIAECFNPPEAAISTNQSFTITGGTGIYAGASGGGRIQRSLGQTAAGAAGPESWTGTLNVAGLEFDLTAPTITGASAKTVRAPKRAKRVRVTFSVRAMDDVDGTVPVTCRPASGSRFKVGRTVVTCSATDGSGNTATARFSVIVRRSR